MVYISCLEHFWNYTSGSRSATTTISSPVFCLEIGLSPALATSQISRQPSLSTRPKSYIGCTPWQLSIAPVLHPFPPMNNIVGCGNQIKRFCNFSQTHGILELRMQENRLENYSISLFSNHRPCTLHECAAIKTYMSAGDVLLGIRVLCRREASTPSGMQTVTACSVSICVLDVTPASFRCLAPCFRVALLDGQLKQLPASFSGQAHIPLTLFSLTLVTVSCSFCCFGISSTPSVTPFTYIPSSFYSSQRRESDSHSQSQYLTHCLRS